MRYPASEKLEVIRIVEQSHLPAKQTLDRLGIARPTFYRWYDLYLRFGEEALEDRRPGPRRGWNRIPDKVRSDILDMALELIVSIVAADLLPDHNDSAAFAFTDLCAHGEPLAICPPETVCIAAPVGSSPKNQYVNAAATASGIFQLRLQWLQQSDR